MKKKVKKNTKVRWIVVAVLVVLVALYFILVNSNVLQSPSSGAYQGGLQEQVGSVDLINDDWCYEVDFPGGSARCSAPDDDCLALGCGECYGDCRAELKCGDQTIRCSPGDGTGNVCRVCTYDESPSIHCVTSQPYRCVSHSCVDGEIVSEICGEQGL